MKTRKRGRNSRKKSYEKLTREKDRGRMFVKQNSLHANSPLKSDPFMSGRVYCGATKLFFNIFYVYYF